MDKHIVTLDRVTAMYRAYVHMRHGKQEELTEVKTAINDLQEGEILQIAPKGGDHHAEEAD